MTKHASLLIIAAFIAQSAFAQSNDYQPGKSGIKFTDMKTYTAPSSTSSSTSSSTAPKTLSADSTSSNAAQTRTAQTKTGKSGKRIYKPASKPVLSDLKGSSSKDLGRADDAPAATTVATSDSSSSNSSPSSSASVSTSSSSPSKPPSKPAASSSSTETAASEPATEETPKIKKRSSGSKLAGFKNFGGVAGAVSSMSSGLAGMGHGGGIASFGRLMGGAASLSKELSTDTVILPNAPPIDYGTAIPAAASGGIDNSVSTAVSGSVLPKKKKGKPQQEESSGPLPEDNRPIADKWAIVMGVGKFKDPTIPSLRYAAKDAQDFADFLIKEQHFAPDHVRLLTNEKATKREFLNEIGDKFLPRVVHRDDLVVLFFSSHGSPAEKDIGGSNFVVAYDTEKENLYSTGIEMQELTRILRERTPRAKDDKEGARVCILMDACHSGGGADGAKDAENSSIDAKSIDVGRGQLVISSSSANERSWESKRYKNGVFTKNLMDALRKDTGVLEAAKDVENLVSNEVQQDDASTQTITVNTKMWTGKKLVLGSKPTNPQPLPPTVKQLLGPDSRSK